MAMTKERLRRYFELENVWLEYGRLRVELRPEFAALQAEFEAWEPRLCVNCRTGFTPPTESEFVRQLQERIVALELELYAHDKQND